MVEHESAAVSGAAAHRRAAAGSAALRCGVVTVSDTRTLADDASGQLICARLRQAGHSIARYAIVKDEAAAIAALVRQLVHERCAVVILNGGTGITRRDVTCEALEPLLEKRLPGFGELLRMLSFQAVGPAAMLSRATAGVCRDSLIFALPGSPNAVALALDRLIIPELAHLVWEVRRHRGPETGAYGGEVRPELTSGATGSDYDHA
ncbi:MogA/MoaB family molybdenum cofactor biosynthesis protein [Kallotenue papyrolyticum]|uniref:MogA/MoaB family molybdenum cofactor biosynthesis protein n=1 Tax=Kallotenue papyrolyticum TaxID=1325125 RepID=UPI00049228E5|nr:molybdenum cofactor biosynthesis protein B [Kallotenue papyrolyticum]